MTQARGLIVIHPRRQVSNIRLTSTQSAITAWGALDRALKWRRLHDM